jgi:small GTP-binding protein
MRKKVVLLGETGVGKTTICRWLQSREFQSDIQPTVGAGFTLLEWRLNGIDVSLEVWDTAGQERFRAIIHTYYRDAQAAVLVFSVTDESSFDELDYWINELKQKGPPELAVVVLANKSDLFCDRVVTPDAIATWQQTFGYQVFETSAASGSGLESAFNSLVSRITDFVRPPPTLEVTSPSGDSECC